MTIQDESILLEAKADSEKEFYVGEWKNIPKGYLAIHLQVLNKNGFRANGSVYIVVLMSRKVQLRVQGSGLYCIEL